MTVTEYTTAQLQELDSAHHLHPRTNLKHLAEHGPLVLERGQGVYVWDTDGKRYIDAVAGLWCVNVGHGRQELIDAGSEQLEKLAYGPTFFGLSTPPATLLARKLADLYPGRINHFHFTSGGAESNESAIKMARYYWALNGKPDKSTILSRQKAYHGIAMGTLSATGIPGFWKNFGPRPPGFVHISAPFAYRNGAGMSEDEYLDSLIAELEETIEREGADTIAAMIGEPIMGGGGVIVPPAEYWSRVAEVLKKNDILLIADEVITGFGRTGKLFAAETYGYQPDIVSMAKGISSGYIPLGAVGVSDEIANVIYEPDAMFMHGFTYSGHPVACAVGLANIDLLLQEQLTENAAEVGEYLLGRLEQLHDHPHVGDVRGKGLMFAVEVVKDKENRTPYDASDGIASKMVAAERKHGILAYGTDAGVILSPPLTLTRAEADDIADAVRAAIVDVLG